MRDLGFTWLDVAALAWFFIWWIGYARFANWYATRQPSLQTMMIKYVR